MTWPFCLRRTLDAMRLRLVGMQAKRDELQQALGAAQVELRKYRLLVASMVENERPK